MDNKQPSKNSASPTPAASPTASPASPQPNQQNQQDVKFQTSSIGKWQAKQDGFFAQQNRERQEKKTKQEASWRKARKFLFIGGGCLLGVAAIVVTVLLIIHFKDDESAISIGNGTSEDIQNFTDELESVYMSDGGTISDVNEAVNKTLNTSAGKRHKNEVLFAQLLFFSDQYYYGGMIEVGEQINPDELTPQQQVDYYNAMSYAYLDNGDTDKGDECRHKAYDMMIELGIGEGGGA